MKVNLSYNEMTKIVAIVEKEVKVLRDGIAEMKCQLNEIYAAERAGAARDEETEMKEEELQNAIISDYRRCTDLSNLLETLKKKC